MFLAAFTSAWAWWPQARHRNSAWVTRFPQRCARIRRTAGRYDGDRLRSRAVRRFQPWRTGLAGRSPIPRRGWTCSGRLWPPPRSAAWPPLPSGRGLGRAVIFAILRSSWTIRSWSRTSVEGGLVGVVQALAAYLPCSSATLVTAFVRDCCRASCGQGLAGLPRVARRSPRDGAGSGHACRCWWSGTTRCPCRCRPPRQLAPTARRARRHRTASRTSDRLPAWR